MFSKSGRYSLMAYNYKDMEVHSKFLIIIIASGYRAFIFISQSEPSLKKLSLIPLNITVS